MKVLVNWQRRKTAFRYPGEPVPRTAVFEPWFGTSSGPQVRVFRTGQWDENQLHEELERFAPQALAASWPRLRELAQSAEDWPALAPTHALIVLHKSVIHRTAESEGPRFEPLAAEDREYLWRTFHVPIFEQVIGPRGILLAGECAAHDGLHLESPEVRPALQPAVHPAVHSAVHPAVHWNGCVETSPCGCGRTTPRLLPCRPAQPVRAIAAYAR